jgi:hypothetical protein
MADLLASWWPEILVFLGLAYFMAVGAFAAVTADANTETESKKVHASRLGLLVAVVILIELLVLAVHGLHALSDWAGSWLELLGIACWVVFLVGLVIGGLRLLAAPFLGMGSQTSKAVKDSAKTTQLMGQSAEFPSEESHKRSGKFK